VVVKEVPPNATVVGIPGKIVLALKRQRKDDLIWSMANCRTHQPRPLPVCLIS
jgi:serine acetyltransferase